VRLELKPGVKVSGISPAMVLAAVVVLCACENLGVDCVITSCIDGVHRQDSKHYLGNALDFRTRDLTPENGLALATDVRQQLGDEYDVVLEADHLHVEFDP
jgi:hypothetical protein